MQSGETRIHRIRLDPFVGLEALAHRDDPVDRQQAVQRLIVELGADGPRCAARGCDRAAVSVDLCAAHYRREFYHGDVAAHRPVASYVFPAYP